MHWKESILFLLLLWFVTVVPQALVNLFAGGSESIGILLFKQILVSVPQIAIVAAGVYCLLSLLPADALEELELERPSSEPVKRGGLFKFSGSPLKLGLVLALSIASTVSLYRVAIESRRMPADTVYELRKAHLTDGKFEIDLIVEDYQKNFSWFSPNQFQLQLTGGPDEEAVKSKLIKPSRALVYDQDDQRVFRENGFKSTDPLRMNLSYNVPENSGVEGFFEIVFYNVNGEVQKLVDERYPRGLRE